MNSLEIIKTLSTLGIESNDLAFNCLYEMILYSQNTNKKIAEDFYYLLVIKFQKSGNQIKRALRYAFYQMEVKNDPLYTELIADKEPTVFNFVESVCEKTKCY